MFIGIDVGREYLDAAPRGGAALPRRVQHREGIAALVAASAPRRDLVVLEATGTYHGPAGGLLRRAAGRVVNRAGGASAQPAGPAQDGSRRCELLAASRAAQEELRRARGEPDGAVA